MKEGSFIRQNKNKWKEYESLAGSVNSVPADRLVSIYHEVLSDLSYARSQYPKSRLPLYLNALSRKFHERLYTSPKHDVLHSLKKLLLRDVPYVVADASREILIVLAIFVFFVTGGVIMALQDIGNVIETLGPGYVGMTLDNIKNGVPTDVYNTSEPDGMFLSILYNNLWVDIKMMMMGLVPFVGTMLFVQANGVMLGEFQTIFFMYDVGWESMLSIWTHGVLEITALIIAGGASLSLGMAWIDFGSYSIMDNVKRKGLRAIKVYLSTIPLTIVAAFLESYVTRHVEWPMPLRLLVILCSLAFVVVYYIILPISVKRKEVSIEELEDMGDE